MARIHKTMRGVTINMDTVRIKNEKVVAVGNMNVNAGGDTLGPGGVVVKDRNQRIKDENALHTMVPGKAGPSVKQQAELTKREAALQAEQEAADKILADSEATGTPKGGLAAEMAEAAPKKKRAVKKK